MKLKQILVVIDSLDINDSSASKGRISLITNLKSAGYKVKVLHYTRKEINLQNIDCKEINEIKVSLVFWLSKLQVLIWRALKININPFIEKLFGFSFSYYNDSKSITYAIQRENPTHYDWVLTLSKAASFRPHHAILKCPQWHHKWLAYIHDPYPMHFYPRPYNWVAPGYYQHQEFMRAVSKACAYGVFPSKLLQEWMGSYFPDYLTRGMVVPHQIIKNIPMVKLPEVFHTDNFIVLHAGSLMKQRDPKGLVEGFELFLEQRPDAKVHAYLCLVGNMNYHQSYLLSKSETIKQLILEDHYVDFNTVYNMQQAAAVNVVLEAKAEISPFLPGKIPHVVAAEKPILHLGPALSETRRILGEHHNFWSEIDDAQKVAGLLSQLYINWQSGNNKVEYNNLKTYMGPEYLKTVFDNLSPNHVVKN